MDAAGNLVSSGTTPSNVGPGVVIAGGGFAITDVTNAWIDDGSHGNGTVTHYIGDQAIQTASDSRVKRDIETWNGRALALINKFRIVKFAWSDPDGSGLDKQNARGPFIGTLAQEAIDVAPWIINAPADSKDCPTCRAGLECDKPDHGYRWHVQYEHLVPTLIKGFQELAAAIKGAKNLADIQRHPALAGI